MSDVTLTLTTATPITLEQSTTTTTLDFDCFDMAAFCATVVAYDNDVDAAAAGKTYYKASASHESAPKGTFIIL